VAFAEPRVVPVIARVLGSLAVALGLLLTFILSLVLGAMLHLDLSSARSLAVRELNVILTPQFKGHIAIDGLRRLSIFGVSGVDATVTAADGTTVIVAKGVSAAIAPFALLKSTLFGKGDLRIGVPSILIDGLETNLDSEPDGSLKLVHAFDPRTPSPPPKPGARGLAIDLQDVSARHIWVHGAIAGVPPIDAEVDALRAAFLSATNVTKLDISHLELAARGLPGGVTPHGVLGAHLAMPSATGSSMEVRGAFNGGVGEVPLTATVALDGDALDAVLNVPEVSAASVQASVDDAPVYQTVSAHGEAHGDLSDLKTHLHAKLGRGSLDLVGNVAAKGALGAHVTVIAKDIDARTFVKDGPATDVGIKIVASVETMPDKTLTARALVDIPAGTAMGQVVPHAALTVDAAQRVSEGAATTTAHLEGVVDEPGAPFALTVDARSRAGLASVTFGAKVDVPRLADVKRVPDLGRGKAQAVLSGHAEVGPTVAFEAHVDASVDGFEHSGVRVDHLILVARGQGALAQPEIAMRVLAHGVSASGYKFSRLEVEVAGTPSRGRVAVAGEGVGTPDVTLKGDVSLDKEVLVHELVLGLKRGARALTAEVGSLRIEGSSIAASGIALNGAGEPLQMSLRSSPGSLAIKATSTGLDLSALAYLAGQEKNMGGRLALDVDVSAQRDHANGKVTVDLTHGQWSKFRDGEAHVNLDLDRRHLTGQLRAAIGDVGSLDLHDVDVHIGGQGALDVASW
jgi:hypothetical protein